MLEALQFSSPETAGLTALSEEEWKKALAFSDRTQLTLPLGLAALDHFPAWVRCRLEQNLAANAGRWRRTQATYRELADGFEQAGLESVVLKGFSHCPDFIGDPRHRWQSDLDLLFLPGQVHRARDIAAGLGYEPVSGFERHPIDHLPVMMRKTPWQWRGDYFDLEMPLPLELHFRLWDEDTECLSPQGLDSFWARRQTRRLDGLCFTSLATLDALAHAALHALRHLLRGDLRPSHIYELASFLDRHWEDAALWSSWPELHPDSLRRLEAISLAIAQRWFDCRMPDAASRQIENLSPEIARWLETCCFSPLACLFHPNKDELWLHWSLVHSFADRAHILGRRLLPQQLPPRVEPAQRRQYLSYLASRGAYHLEALPSVAWSGLRWFWPGARLGRKFWTFYSAFALFNFGMFIYFLLYNLYLLQLGFREDFLGLVAGTMAGGSIAGSLLSAAAIRRFGLRNTLAACFLMVACSAALRAVLTASPALLALAAVSGILTAAWAVCLSPIVAALTIEKNRAVAFSFIFSTGILIGVLGGLAGGHLPGLLSRMHLAASSIASYRGALLTGCILILAAVWPLLRVEIAAAPAGQRRFFRPSPVVTRFLMAIAAWNLGIGIFNPFFNVFFAKLRMPVEQIGTLFSAAHFAQAGAVLMAPLVLRRFGLTRGVSLMQFATGVALLALSAAAGPVTAGLAYAAYTMSQYMTEPGLFTFLMDGVKPEERSNASALNFLVTFAAQAVVAAASGRLLARFGYPPVLIAAAIICALAALLFCALLAHPKSPAPSDS